MYTITTKHHINFSYPGKIEKTVKTYKLFGIVLKKKTHLYPGVYEYDLLDA